MPFVMHGARDAVAGGLTHVEQQVKSIEQAALAWLESTGWSVINGTAIAPGEPAAEVTA